MKVVLDLHDFSVLNNRLDLLLQLKEYYPDFKVSLFTIPFDIKRQVGNKEEALNLIRKHLDWLQIIPHGLFHNSSEMRRCDYQRFRYKVIPSIRKYFDRDGLPFVQGFCAPHWNWNKDVVKALDDIDWWGAISPARPDMVSTRRYYTYDYAIDQAFDLSKEVIRIHGHIGSTDNDLEKCMDNLLRLPKDVEWHFVTDFVSTKGENE